VRVLVADDDISAFSPLRNHVHAASVPRGELGGDAWLSTGSGADFSQDSLDQAVSLRLIRKGSIIRKAAVSPPITTNAANPLVIELARDNREIDALDLRPGDKLLLQGSRKSGVTARCDKAALATGGDWFVEGMVLSVDTDRTAASSSLLIQIDSADAESGCLGDLSQLQILRRLT